MPDFQNGGVDTVRCYFYRGAVDIGRIVARKASNNARSCITRGSNLIPSRLWPDEYIRDVFLRPQLFERTIMRTYRIELCDHDDNPVRETFATITDESIQTMEQVAIAVHRLFMVAQYDKQYGGFVVYDPNPDEENSQNLFMELVE